MSAPVVPVNLQVPADATAPVVADFAVHALRVAYAKRRDIESLTAEWAAPGVYVLLTDDGSSQMYVGQAVALRKRLMQHRVKPKIAWTRAVAIKRDTSHGFNSAEIGYLEGRLAAELGALPGTVVIEGLRTQDTTLPDHHMLALDALVPSMLAALRIAGVDLLKASEIEEPTGNGAGGKRTHTAVAGTIADLLAAGLLRAGAQLTFERAGRRGIAKVTASGDLVVSGVTYDNPSRAAKEALGLKAANGWTSWHLDGGDGPTLADLRAKLPATEIA